MHKKNNTELEVRFINLDIPSIKQKLKELGAKNHGEDFLREVMIYDKDFTWREERKVVRIRKTKKQTLVAFKHHSTTGSTHAKEIEFEVTDGEKVQQFLEAIGLKTYRIQEKKRHTYTLSNVTIDIDTWPTMPPYIELEGKSEKELKDLASLLGIDWKDVILRDAAYVIKHYYNIPVLDLKLFTFDKIE